MVACASNELDHHCRSAVLSARLVRHSAPAQLGATSTRLCDPVSTAATRRSVSHVCLCKQRLSAQAPTGVHLFRDLTIMEGMNRCGVSDLGVRGL
jgi:hypothetical protein